MASNVQSKLLKEAALRYAQEISPEALVVLAERGISEEVASRFELGTITDPINGHEMYEGWISIPYMTALDMCVGFKFRRLDDGKPKYSSPTGQKAHLYNVKDTLIMSPHIVVCEGELDTVITSGVLGIPAVGIPGVQAWKPHFAKLFTGYSKRVASEILNSQIVTLPPGMDINDYYLAHGADATRALLVGEPKGE